MEAKLLTRTEVRRREQAEKAKEAKRRAEVKRKALVATAATETRLRQAMKEYTRTQRRAVPYVITRSVQWNVFGGVYEIKLSSPLITVGIQQEHDTWTKLYIHKADLRTNIQQVLAQRFPKMIVTR